MKKTKRIFRHFLAILNVIACGVPLITLGIVTLQDVLPKYFTSLGMQHHGDGSSTFDEDIDSLSTSNQFNDVNENILQTLDKMDYLKYGGESTKIVKKTLQTNDVNSTDDLIIGNYYHFNIDNTTLDNYFYNGNIAMLFFNITNYDFTEYTFITDEFINNTYVNNGDIAILVTIDSDYYTSFNVYFTYNNVNDYFVTMSPDETLDNFSFTFQGDFKLIECSDTFTITDSDCFSATTKTYYEEVESDIVGYNGWKDAYDGENYSTIVTEGTDTHLVLNLDFISLFQTSDIVNYNNNVAIYLFINFYFNYLLNVLLLLFLPEFILLFIDFVKQLLYKFTDVKGDS